MPERADEQIPIDKPLEFWALAMNEEQVQKFQQEKIYTGPEIEQSRAGRIRLVILPRGIGKIEVSAVSLFSEIEKGNSVETSFKIRNTGTRRLDNVRISAEPPLNWSVEVTPDLVAALDINREVEVALRMVPPSDVPVGDYEARLKTESYAYNRQVPSEDKIYRISVIAQANVWGTVLLIGGLLVLVLGLVIFGVKLTRR